MKSYSQALQDNFVLSLFPTDYKGIFLDVGCSFPTSINNTLLLEENGWNGVSIDILNYKEEWKIRNTKFICDDALKCNYNEILTNVISSNIIDYLSLDIEGDGLRYLALRKVIESGLIFKVITIEHDVYRGYDITERQPQRKFLIEKGYILLCSDVSHSGLPYEDWWINPDFFKEEEYGFYFSSDLDYSDILKKYYKKYE